MAEPASGAVGDWATEPHRYLGAEHPAHLGVSCMRYQDGDRPGQARRVATIAIDFDGVIHAYSRGWHDGTIYDEPMPGAIEGLRQLQGWYAVFVFTSREVEQVVPWLEARGLNVAADGPPYPVFWGHQDQILVTNRKLPAVAYIDDRAVPFTTWDYLLAVQMGKCC